MTPAELSQSTKALARECGFDWAGICPAVAAPGVGRFEEWLESGFHGQMDYLADRREACSHPRHVLEGVRSIVMLALRYDIQAMPGLPTGAGRVSRYAYGTRDYHDVIHGKLKDLKKRVQQLAPGAAVRGVVDTAPLLEREYAVLAGLGWQGKNTLLLSRTAGSWFFLAALLTDLEMAVDEPYSGDFCGSCTACLDACPTEALIQPNLLDATRCISYLTIELRDPVPRELRPGIGNWVFGCDVCQDVCPWNRMAGHTAVAEFEPAAELNPLSLPELFELDDARFRKRFRRTPLWRARRRGMLRNAAIVLGNQGRPQAIPALVRGLNDAEPLVRGAAAWALGRIGHSRSALAERLEQEADATVREEIRQALQEC